jgi:hypothetical protein
MEGEGDESGKRRGRSTQPAIPRAAFAANQAPSTVNPPAVNVQKI